ncbi:MAG: TlyA family RNA methyltransferase [Candidatus Obscuribacterales bacterium]|nr:TlyA family RNA methyltransferase [Candidatus Obscuribacterales bacterium]
MPKGQRLDLLLVEKGLFPSREAAQAAIMDGGIIVNGHKITKAGTSIAADAKIEVTSDWQPRKYVSRGGLKLEKALEQFQIDVNNRICLDVGASTGGFTDCLLTHGAAKVYAVDVGYGQIAWSLRTDGRVVVLERINARNLDAGAIYGEDKWADMAVMDVSFISLDKILPSCLNVLDKDNLDIVALIKPQFEAGKENVGKGGVIRSADQHKEILSKVIAYAEKLNLYANALTYSPIKGPSGNIEFLVRWTLKETSPIDINQTVDEAHLNLSRVKDDD